MWLEKEQFLVWNDRYSVGIDFMDEQHRRLVEFANELYDGVFAALEASEFKKKREESFKACMSASVDYVKTHFSAEEDLMRSLGYPKFPEHKTAHEEFVRQVLEVSQRFEKGDQQMGKHFVYFLRDWLLEHIGVVDKELGMYAKNNQHS